MDINDADSSACSALRFLCELHRSAPTSHFCVESTSAEMGISETEGRSIFGYLVGKGLAQFRYEPAKGENAALCALKGVYLVVIKSAKGVQTKKIVL